MTSLTQNNFVRKNDIPEEWLEKFIPLGNIGKKMLKEGMSKEFVYSLFPLALHYEGTYDLMIMWAEEDDRKFKNEIIADLQEEIEEEQGSTCILPKKLEKKDYLHFDNLEKIAKDVMKFKKNLKIEVERWGGISKLAKKTGMPQASLSRFLNSPSLPRRNTIEKIAKAMNLKNSRLLTQWLS